MVRRGLGHDEVGAVEIPGVNHLLVPAVLVGHRHTHVQRCDGGACHLTRFVADDGAGVRLARAPLVGADRRPGRAGGGLQRSGVARAGVVIAHRHGEELVVVGPRRLAHRGAVAANPDLELANVWTHFATADEPDGDEGYFFEQLARFEPVAEAVHAEHPGVTVHAANSAAVFRSSRSHFDMARCGVAIYGLDPFQDDPASRGLAPVLSLRSYVAAVKRFPAGQSAGYGRRWRAPEDTWVGVIPLGYGDGVRRALSDDCEVLVEGRRHPLVGTISMDNLTIDFGPETDVRPGAEAVLIGRQGAEEIRAEEIAARLDTINYEITCAISPRVPRRPG